MSNVEDILKKIFISSLGLKKNINFNKLKYGDPNWDSVAHMKLIAQIEKKLKISIDVEDVVDMSSFKKAISLIDKYVD